MLGEHDRSMTVVDILQAVALIPKELEKAFVLRDVAPFLLAEQWRNAMRAISSVADARCRSVALTGIALYLPDALLPEAIRAAQELHTAEYRCAALAALAQRLTGDARGEILEEALIAMLQMNDAEKEHPRLSVLNREPNFDRRPNCSAAQMLVDLTAQLPEPLWRDALSVARELPGSACRAEALVALASLLPSSLLPELIDALQTIQHEQFQTQALIALLPHLPENLLDHVLAAAREIEDDSMRVQVFVGVATRMPADAQNELLVEALEVARMIEQPLACARALAETAPYLPQTLLDEALMHARLIAALDARAYALVRLIPCFAEDQREVLLIETLDIAMLHLSHRWRRETLAQLAPHLARLPRRKLYGLWCDLLYDLAQSSRADLLTDLRELTPVIAALGGQNAITECAQAIIEMSRLFP
jgi:hypothetical protein